MTFTLTPTSSGTHLRMEQVGFRPDQKQAFGGAKAGWQQFFGQLETLLGKQSWREATTKSIVVERVIPHAPRNLAERSLRRR